MQLVRFDYLVATVMTCLGQGGKCSGHRQKEYGHTFTTHLKKAVNDLTRKVRNLVQI